MAVAWVQAVPGDVVVASSATNAALRTDTSVYDASA